VAALLSADRGGAHAAQRVSPGHPSAWFLCRLIACIMPMRANRNEPNDLTGLKVGGKWGDLIPSISEGQNYLWHTDRGGGQPLFGWRTHYWSFPRHRDDSWRTTFRR